MSVIRQFLERTLLVALRGVGDVRTVAGLEFCDLTGIQDPAIPSTIISASECLKRAGAEYAQLVPGEISLLAVSSFADVMLPYAQVCFSKFQGRARSEPLFLATHLVGVAAYMRKHRQARATRMKTGHRELWRLGAKEQLAFLSALGKEPEWLNVVQARAQASGR
jgi:hypothetical protein